MELRLKSYEIDLIDYCLRIVINHYKRPFDLHYKKEFFDRYSQLSIDRLITSRTTDELVDNLKGTEYYDPLKKLQDAQKVTLYDYDLALELYFFTTLWKARKKMLKKEDLELYERVIWCRAGKNGRRICNKDQRVVEAAYSGSIHRKSDLEYTSYR